MCDKELLVAYLYEDLSGPERAGFEAHVRECAECRDELKALGAVRVDLAEWTPPQSNLGFRVVRGASETGHVLRMPAAASWRAWWTPAAGFAAAAVLVLAAASAIAHVEVHGGPDGLTVRTGWPSVAAGSGQSIAGASPVAVVGTSPAASGAGVNGQIANAAVSPKTPQTRQTRQTRQTTTAPIGEGVLTADVAFVAELERRLRVLETASLRDGGLRSVSARAGDTEIIKRVRELLAQSETRQKGELALRIAQVIRDVDAQRVADLSAIQRGLGRIDATVTAEAASHRDLTNFILTSAKQK
jgi:hypothetical protein